MSILNEKQQEVAHFVEGSAMVVAIAGSGKTNTICHRVANLLNMGINPQNIFMLTFTNKASSEMQHRTKHILKDTEHVSQVDNLISGTFHSIANLFLRKYTNSLGGNGNYTIIDSGDAITILNKFKALTDNSLYCKELFKKIDPVYSIISYAINTCQSIESAIYQRFSKYKDEIDIINQWYQQYTQYKKENNLVDYDDLILNFIKLLETDSPISSKIKQQAQFIMIDEYQDTNALQFRLSELLAETHKNIMVIGDDCQSIYSWRGANYKNMFNFTSVFTDAKLFILDKNYRSYQGILDIANYTISLMKHKFDKHLETALYPSVNYRPVLYSCFTAQQQAQHIVNHAQKANLAFHKQCALIRTNMQSFLLEKELNKAKIPYVKYGGLKFNELSHVKDFLFLLRLVLNQKDELAFLRTFTLLPKLGDKTAQKLYDLQESLSWVDMLKKVKKNNAYDKYITIFTQFEDWANIPCFELTSKMYDLYRELAPFNYDADDITERLEDIQTLVGISKDYTNTASFLSDFTLDNSKLSKEEHPDKFIISTIHSAKGLEWDIVYLLNCGTDSFDNSFKLRSVEDQEEDKRLFYVAVTRAKFKLNMYFVKSNFDGSYNKLISYLKDTSLYSNYNI